MDLGIQSGTSKAGNPWKKREMVLETGGNYPQKVKFHIFGDRVDSLNLEVGKDYSLSFDLSSREFNGRWYTDVSVFAAREANASQGGAPAYGDPAPQYGQGPAAYPGDQAFSTPAQPTFTAPPASSDEDLPF